MNQFLSALSYEIFGSLLFIFIESVLMWLEWPPIFAFGPRLWNETRPMKRPKLTNGMSFETKNGIFQIISHDLIIFRWRYHFLGLFSFVKRPLRIKYSIRWQGDRATATGRFLLGHTLFLIGWLSWVLCFLGILYLTALSNWSTRPLEVLALLLVSTTVLGVLTMFIYWFLHSRNLELTRAKTLWNEFQNHIENDHKHVSHL